MQFEKGYIYHIYNQGNNRQRIFFYRENYLYFLRKINTYITPYADIMAWCLMPNHFHLMVYVRKISVVVGRKENVGASKNSVGVAQSGTDAIKYRTFNDSIGIMLRSYTNAINKQQKRTGKLFREKTKAECVNCFNGTTPSFDLENGTTKINITQPERQYPEILFHYIHNNPVKAGLVKKITDWEFSSAKDYYQNRKGKLINKKITKEYININLM